MTFHAGPVPAGTSLYIPFTTYAGSTGASATCTGLAVTDVEIYKNGSTTQRSSDAGIALLDTDGIDFDGITGLHGFSIDLSDNTDAGFYAVGSWYWVVVSAITVDSQTVTFLAATFRIAPAESITGYPKTDQHALKGDAQSATDLQDFADAGYDPATNKVQGVVLVDTLTTYTSNTPQTGDTYALANGAAGFVAIDTVVDAILDDTGTSGVLLSTTALGAIWNRLTSSLTTVGSIGKWILDNLTGDIYARLGAPAGASIAADIASVQADATTLLGRITSARAGYLDNLNVGGAVASNADILALNQSASRRIILTTVGQYERPESGSTTYTIEARTYDGDGASVNADSDPTLTVTGQTTGSLAANVGVVSNPATGVYRWTYTQSSAATLEPIRVDVSATISSSTFTLSAYTQSVDFVSATWTTTDASNLTSIFNKLPVNNIADQTLLNAAIADVPTNAELATALATGVNVTQIEGSNLGAHGIGQFPADVRDWGGLGAVIAIDIDNSAPSVAVGHIHDDVISAAAVSAAAVTKIQNGLASQTSVDDLPTNAEFATALAAADDAVLAAIAALNNLSAAQVNAEVLDVLNVDTFGELAAPPAANSTLRDKLTWIFMCHRNLRTETATQRKLYADNGSTLVGTEAVSDNGTTFTKEKVV